jgi:hypothetical protein
VMGDSVGRRVQPELMGSANASIEEAKMCDDP